MKKQRRNPWLVPRGQAEPHRTFASMFLHRFHCLPRFFLGYRGNLQYGSLSWKKSPGCALMPQAVKAPTDCRFQGCLCICKLVNQRASLATIRAEYGGPFKGSKLEGSFWRGCQAALILYGKNTWSWTFLQSIQLRDVFRIIFHEFQKMSGDISTIHGYPGSVSHGEYLGTFYFRI